MPATADALGIAELRQLLLAADPAALLVPPRLLRRVIKQDRQLTSLGLQVPHHKSYAIAREALLTLAARDELGVAAEATLPATLLLIAEPEPEELSAGRDDTLVRYWRLLFHLRVHQAVRERLDAHPHARAVIRERIHRIGQTEFDEIRAVLRQEKYLLPPRSDRGVYEEFAAVYLELTYFAATLLPRYFPAIEHCREVERILTEDVDASALFAATRLAGAPDPVFPIDLPENGAPAEPLAAMTPVKAETRQRLLTAAERVAAAGNSVRAVLLRARAGDEAAARSALDQLIGRLGQALGLEPAAGVEWAAALTALLPRAADGFWPQEARFLYDLQKACLAHEQPVFAPNLVGWLMSWGRQPLMRPLPDQPLVLTVKQLRSAAQRIPALRISTADQHRLTGLLHHALEHAEEKLRERFGPVLAKVLEQVGLQPANFPERMARDTIVAELLDRITERGFINIGDLRDAIARNQLKLPDVAHAGEWLMGDALLQANEELPHRLAGIYRHGEVYLRIMQRGSAAAFGTRVGRWLTLFVALPFLGAYGTIVFIQEMIHIANKLHGIHLPHHLDAHEMAGVVGGLALFYLALLHLPSFRHGLVRGVQVSAHAVRMLLLDLPTAVLTYPLIRSLLRSRPVVLAYHYLLKPLPPTLLVWLGLWLADADLATHATVAGLVFVTVSLLANSRLGRDCEEAFIDWTVRRWHYFRDVVPGIVRWVEDVFKRFLEIVDRGLYTVDEWLRFRSGENRVALVLKSGLSALWSVVTYVIRLYLNVFIEPTINPVKHFPTVTVAAKLLVPYWVSLTEFMATPLLLFMGRPLAYTIAFLNLHAIPGAAGFLAWELKENWRLYRANRQPTLRPAAVGHHGETMLRLMRPGFHSGTLPKLYARLRRAERKALRRGDWRTPRKLREAIHHVEHSVRLFAERALVAFLNGAKGWSAGPVELATVEAASNRIRLGIACPALGEGEDALELNFEEQSGWLVAHIAHPGWLPRLTPEQAAVLTMVLTGFYQECGVDLVREQIDGVFPPESAAYDLADLGLVVWPNHNYETEVVYDLLEGPLLHPRVREGQPATAPPVLRAEQLLFRSKPVTWDAWVAAWERDQAGAPPQPLLPGVRVLPLVHAG